MQRFVHTHAVAMLVVGPELLFYFFFFIYRVFDLVNIHLFHDASNMVAMQNVSMPSRLTVYEGNIIKNICTWGPT